MVADPGQVVHSERGAGDDAKPAFAEPGDGEVALDAPALVRHLRIGQLADIAGDLVVGEAFEEVRGASAADLDLRERGEIEDGRRLPTCSVLDPDRGRPEAPRPAVRPERLVALRPVGLEPVDALPARLLPERRPEIGEPRIERRNP